MKFLVVIFVAVALFAPSMGQTTDNIDTLISELESELASPTSSTSPDYTSDYYYYTSPISTYPTYYYYDYDVSTTAKPIKQQFLSLLFNKKAG